MKKIYKYLITTFIGILISFSVLLYKKSFNVTSYQELFHHLSDATVVSGVLLIGMGLLIGIANTDFFDIFKYGILSFFNMFRRNNFIRKYETYYDYKEARKDKAKISYLYIIIIGLVFILMSIIFLILYTKY